MKKLLFFPIVLLLLSPLVQAQDETITILGAGSSTCAKYLSDAGSSQVFQSVYLNWAMGYLTAINVSNSVKAGTKMIRDPSGVEASLQTFCRANPAKNFSDAVLAFSLRALR